MDSLKTIDSLSVPLETKLRLLRELACVEGKNETLTRWAQQHPEIATGDHWCERVWWGVAAGVVVRKHLNDPDGHESALKLLAQADWSALDEARRGGGVIVATAHVGPPKFLMSVLSHQAWPLLFWTNTRGIPEWFYSRRASMFLNPMTASQRAVLMIKSAFHLRQGGVLLGAADMATGQQTVTLERLGKPWLFSLGLPALARNLNVPVIICLALWTGNTIRINCTRMNLPDRALPEKSWYAAWIQSYWEYLEPVIRTSPENLRFMRKVVSLDAAPPDKRP